METKDAPEVFFCCCEGSLCNNKFFYSPDNSQTQTILPSESHGQLAPPRLLTDIPVALCGLFCLDGFVPPEVPLTDVATGSDVLSRSQSVK